MLEISRSSARLWLSQATFKSNRVLDGPKDDKLFAAVAKAARPYLMGREKKIDLNITTSISPLGQQGMRGSEPFYRKGIGRIMDEDDDE